MFTYYRDSEDRKLSNWQVEEMHDDLLDELYPMVTVGIYQWSPSRVLKTMDPVAYQVSVIEYIDQLIDDGQLRED